jgi:arylsulfatase A-like enzyme
MVSFIEEEVGRLRAHLDQIGRGDDTYIVFTADHGEYLGDHGMVRKSVALYDCLVRVPLIVSGPGIAPGASSNFLASSLDITPTLLDFASVPDPHRREGLSLASHLRGGPAPERPHVFGTFGVAGHAITQAEVEALDFDYLFEHPYVWGSWVSPLTMRGRAIMVRGQNAKLVVHEGGFRELYDLARDPDELRNIYGSDDTTHLERELMSALADWLLSQVPDVPPYEATWP